MRQTLSHVSSIRYLIICVGRNCEPWAARCLNTIAEQQGDWRAVVVDDASTDETREQIDKTLAALPEHIAQRFTVWTNAEPVGAMKNQRDAWLHADAKGCDVAIFCDLDDRLAHDHVLTVLDRYYRAGMLTTYGNYEADPPSATCPKVRPFPPRVLRQGTIRTYIRDQGGGFFFNHIRTCHMRILHALTDADLQDDDGQWWQTGPDSAVMLSAIEMARTRVAVISEVLLKYTSDNPSSEWRVAAPTVNENHRQQLNRAPKPGLR